MFEEMLIPKIARRIKLIREAKHPTLGTNKSKITHEELFGESRGIISAVENGKIRPGNRSYLPPDTLNDLSRKLQITPQEVIFGVELEQKEFIKDIFDLISIYSCTEDFKSKNKLREESIQRAEKALWHLFISRAKFSYLFAEIDKYATQSVKEMMQNEKLWPSTIKETFEETKDRIWFLVNQKLFESFKKTFILDQEKVVVREEENKKAFVHIDERIIYWIETEFVRIINHVSNSRSIVPIYMIGYQVHSLMDFASIQIDKQLLIQSPEELGSLLKVLGNKGEEIDNLSISLIYFDTIRKLVDYQEKGLAQADKAFDELAEMGKYSLYN